METKTATHAEIELDILSKSSGDPNNRPIIEPFKNEIIALCEAFGKSGQSGGSASYVASAISKAVEKLMMFQTITPLLGEDSEWSVQGTSDDEPMFQNNRDGRVFKNGKNGKPYFIEAIVFDGDIGGRFTGNGSITTNEGEIICSAQYIKEFPFTPKTFYVNVIDHRFKDKEEKQPDANGDWWTHSLKDEKQLAEVFEYYDMLF